MESGLIKENNPYEVLNISPESDFQTIRERYYQYSKAFHPDKQPYELYEDSKRYFLMIEEAYKSLATPFCRYLYDLLGRVGIENYHKYPKLFGDLDETYDSLVYKMQELEDIEKKSTLEYKNLKKEKRKMEQNIIKRYFYLLNKSNEEILYTGLFKKINMKVEINLNEYFGDPHYWLCPQTNVLKKSFSTGIHLPNFKDIQSDVFLYYDTNEEDSKFGFIFKLHRRFIIPKLNQPINLKCSLNHPSVGPSIAWFHVDKEIPQLGGMIGYSYTNNFDASNSDIFFNKNLDDTSAAHFSLKFSGGRPVILNAEYQKKLRKYKAKMVTNMEATPRQITIENEIIRELTDRIAVSVGLVAEHDKTSFSYRYYLNFFGFKIKLNKHTRIEIQNCLFYNRQRILLRLTRYNMHLEVPLEFASYATFSGLIVGLVSIAFTFIAAFAMENKRNNSTRKIKMLQKKYKGRLLTAKNHFDMVKSKYAEKALPMEQAERRKNGLIILRAAYGNPKKICALHKKEKNIKGSSVYEDKSSSENYDEASAEIFAEVLDLTRYLQVFVVNSSLAFTLDKLEKSKGIFNPCLNEKTEPILYIRWIYNGQVKAAVFKKKEKLFKLGKLGETSWFSLLNYFI